MPDVAVTIYDYLKIPIGIFEPELEGNSLLTEQKVEIKGESYSQE